MRIVRKRAILWLSLVALLLLSQRVLAQQAATLSSRYGLLQVQPSQAEQLFALANEARAQRGLPLLRWDQALAAGALKHCLRMAREGPIAHRYGGEPDVSARASQAGAHFSLIEENIAVGPYPAAIHAGWMRSAGHRANLLNPGVDSLGVAVVSRGGTLFAVADFARSVRVLRRSQIEDAVAGQLQGRGLALSLDTAQARAYCASSGRFSGPDPPDFAFLWQDSDLTHLPAALSRQAASGRYRRAAVASCAPQNVDGAFTVYRVAVLLYGATVATIR